MQLKREVDYAIRLLFQLRRKSISREKAMSVSALCAASGVPRITASRILKKLSDAEVINVADFEKNRLCYFANEMTGRITLYQLVSVIEGKAELFAAFEKSTSVYKICKRKLQMTESEINACLSNVSLNDLLDEEKN